MHHTFCTHCNAHQQVPKHYLRTEIKCLKCGSMYTATEGSAPVKSSGEQRYFLLKDNEPKGPYTFEDLVELQTRGGITLFDKICREGSDHWVDAFKVLKPVESVIQQNTPHQPTTSNVVAGIASFFVPGLGQLVQGRFGAAIVHFISSGILWLILLGWIIHLLSAYGAATYRPKQA